MFLKIHFLPKIHHTHSELFLRSVPLLLQWSLAANIHLKAYYSLLFLIREPAFVDYNSICQFLQWPYLKNLSIQMFQFMTETLCHFTFAGYHYFFTVFIQCLYCNLIRSDGFSKTVWEAKAAFNTFLKAMAF